MNYTKVAVENGRINKDLDYKIYLKDNNGYCFDENTGDDEVMLKVKLIGPYILKNTVINYKIHQIQKLVERKKTELIQIPSIEKNNKK